MSSETVDSGSLGGREMNETKHQKGKITGDQDRKRNIQNTKPLMVLGKVRGTEETPPNSGEREAGHEKMKKKAKTQASLNEPME